MADGLKRLGVRPGDHLCVHSSLMPFGLPTEGAATYLAPLLEAVGPSGTLAMPTFSFGFISSGAYHYRETPSSGMGALSEAARHHKDALRTRHPMQSLAVIGHHAAQLAAIETPSAYGKGSTFAQMRDLDFKVLLLGATPIHISHSHLVEEERAVPYRFTKKVAGSAQFDAAAPETEATWDFYARYLDIDIFPEGEDMIVEELVNTGQWASADIAGTPISMGRAQAFCGLLDAKLAGDPFWMLPNAEDVRRFCATRRQP